MLIIEVFLQRNLGYMLRVGGNGMAGTTMTIPVFEGEKLPSLGF